MAGSEDGSRCAELRPLLSSYCDGEAPPAEAATVREHLRACAGCRATMRAYRSAPAAVAALAPALPASRSLIERGQELLAGLHARLPGIGGGDSSVAQVAAAGGTRGAGMAALAKALAICAGTVGGAAACVATGVAPLPLDLAPEAMRAPRVERISPQAVEEAAAPAVAYEPATEPAPQPKPERRHNPAPVQAETEAAPTEASTAGAVEYTPPAPSPPPVAEAPPAAPSDSAAGEFGP